MRSARVLSPYGNAAGRSRNWRSPVDRGVRVAVQPDGRKSGGPAEEVGAGSSVRPVLTDWIARMATQGAQENLERALCRHSSGSETSLSGRFHTSSEPLNRPQ
jgi:hypothetical protein